MIVHGEKPRECPDCGEELVLRRNKEDETFYGCSDFPECRYTESDDDEEIIGWDKNNVDYKD